ncbi:MAG: hypothetical protein ACO3C8_04185, partial [Bacilli bacterium]
LVILLAGKRSLPYSLIHPIKLKETIANRAMNTARKTWYHPVTKVASRQSFSQLMDEALTLFASLIPLLQADTFDEKKWRAFTQGIDYDGKIYQTKMSHQDSYYQP